MTTNGVKCLLDSTLFCFYAIRSDIRPKRNNGHALDWSPLVFIKEAAKETAESLGAE
jgi:hypothetical protein